MDIVTPTRDRDLSLLTLTITSMENEDPISTFFPDEEDVDLYAVLGLSNTATADEIKKAYRRLALVHHPDKQQQGSSSSLKFQQVGFAYAVLSDTKRRERYDLTGRTDEGFELQAGEDGWEAYFEAMFDEVTRGRLDEMKEEYQGSLEETDDLKAAYIECKGSIEDIMTRIPHSTNDDEPRFIVLISQLVSSGQLPRFDAWEKGVKDEKAKLVRKKQSEKEAKQAEQLARELGVWDEFYGSGKKGERKGKGKGKGKSKAAAADEEEEGDVSALQALILNKRKKASGFLDGLAAKYAEEPKKTGKRGRPVEDEPVEERGSKKKRKGAKTAEPDIGDEEFAKLQEKLFGDKARRKR